MDWLDLLAVQGTLKGLLQHHSLKAWVLRLSAFFMVQLSHLYGYWKNHSFDLHGPTWTFVSKVISLLFNMLSRFVTTFLLRSKHLFNFMAAVTTCSDFGAQENSLSLFPFFPHIFAEK